MFVLEQILWIALIFYIDFFMPVSCQAALETNNFWIKNDEDALHTCTMKPIRRLHDWDVNYMTSSSSDRSIALFYVLIGAAITLISLLIRCCIRLAREPYEETSNTVAHPPPPRTQYHIGTFSATSRPLAPPRTGSSLIIFPDGASNNSVFLGIENPSYTSTAVTTAPTYVREERRPVQSQQIMPERRNSNPTPLFDLPPAYDSIANSNAPNTDSKPSLGSYMTTDSHEEAPPKYNGTL